MVARGGVSMRCATALRLDQAKRSVMDYHYHIQFSLHQGAQHVTITDRDLSRDRLVAIFKVSL